MNTKTLPLYAEIDRLRAEKAELLEALKVCQVWVFMHDGSTCKAYRQAAKAIAAAERNEP